MRGKSVWWMGLAVMAIMGCGKKADNGSPSSDSGIAVDPPQATYAWVEKHILAAKCTECHSGGKAKGGVKLDGGYNEILKFVQPGDPDASDLWNAIDSGGMPLKRAPLPETHKAALKKWIADGAKNQ